MAGTIALLVWLQTHTPDPIHDGRPVSEWVRLAFREGRPGADPVNARQGVAWRKVVQIGSPAVPYVARGLTDSNHRLLNRKLDWLRWHLPGPIRWDGPLSCVIRHYDALALLQEMGEAARPAVPEVVRCFQECPCAHYMDAMACIEWLRDMGPIASAARPFLVRLSRETNSYVLEAAVAAYYVTGETDRDVLTEAFCREARRNPEGFVSAREPFWFRDDVKVNRRLVPVLTDIVTNATTDTKTRICIVGHLHECGTNSLPALPVLQELLRTSNSPELRQEILAALPRILGQVTEEEEAAREADQKKAREAVDRETSNGQ